MKAQLFGNQSREQGSSTLEVLIALGVLVVSLSATIMVVFGNQSVVVDTATNNEGLYLTGKLLEEAADLAKQNFTALSSATSTEKSGPLLFDTALEVIDESPCKKEVTSSASWATSSLRTQKVLLKTVLADIAGSLALGGDCATEAPESDWDDPERFASDTLSPGKPVALDVLNAKAYVGTDKTPYLQIASTSYAIYEQTDGLFIDFTNGFALATSSNALDAISFYDSTTDETKTYLFAAMDSRPGQLAVIDVTDIEKPLLVATRSLSSCVTGSFPQGWRIYYYGSKLYLTTRYTAGPEFHIFDVSDPTAPTEFGTGACKGFDLGDTAESLTVADQYVGGIKRRFAYLATDEMDKELRVLDVTNPLAVTEVNSINLPGVQDGQSVYLSGNKLFFGRQSAPSGPDLYVFDVSDPTLPMPLLGSQDIGTGVLSIRVAGRFAFLSTPKVDKEVQIWNISKLSNITLIKAYNFGNVTNQGIDYEPDFLYVTSLATPNFQILRNKP